MKHQTSVAILGAGSWGTAIAIHLARHGNRVLLWSHNPEKVKAMQRLKTNPDYLGDIDFPDLIEVTDNMDLAVRKTDMCIIAVPSHAFNSVINLIQAPLRSIAWITKGLDPSSNHLLSECVGIRYGRRFPMAVISGPSFAREVAEGLPTAITIASNDHPLQLKLHRYFHHGHFRAYLSDDLIGVQVGGAVKNVLAIACGISDGMGFGANAKAALITRGLAEMRRLGSAIGARDETFMGLAGIGDLVLTCTDDQSRNRRFGLLVGQGITIDDAEKRIQQVVEGMHNAGQVCAIAQIQGIDMPICEQVHQLIQGTISLNQAIKNLFNRPPKDET